MSRIAAFDLILAANRLGRHAIGQLDERADVAERPRSRYTRLKMDGESMFEELEAGALRPAAIGIRTAEGGGHRLVEVAAQNRVVGLQVGEKEADSLAIRSGGRFEEIGHEWGLLGGCTSGSYTLSIPLPSPPTLCA